MRWLVLFLALLAAACDEAPVAEAPAPVEPTREAMTYFGRMILVDHLGPKAQIHLKGEAEPLWFPAVRDARAFVLLPGERKDITAVYVTDMARAESWDQPRSWAPAEEMVYVIGSDARGGMGAPETVPFGDRAAAEVFVGEHGGEIVSWDAITEEDVLGEAPEETGPPPHLDPMHAGSICLSPRPTEIAEGKAAP